jgi:hypothetical protein
MTTVYVVAAVAAISDTLPVHSHGPIPLALLAWLITWIHHCSQASHHGYQAIIVGPTTTRWEALSVSTIGVSHRLIGCHRGRFPRFDPPALLIILMKSSSPHREYNSRFDSRFDSDSKEANIMTVDSQGTKARAVVGPYDDLSWNRY